jgi:methyl-accepting chemotaxis protein
MTYDPNRPTTYTGTGTQREFEQTADQAQSAAENLRDKAEDVADDVRDKAQQVGSQVADKADAATTTVGDKMTDVAQTIRQKAPVSGPMADAADTAADTLQRAGTYLQQQDLNDMRADLEGIIRRHPIESLLIGLGIGYLLARSTRR